MRVLTPLTKDIPHTLHNVSSMLHAGDSVFFFFSVKAYGLMNSTKNQTVFAFKVFALQIQDLDPQEYQGQTFSIDLGSVEEAMKVEQRIEEGDLMTSETVMEAVSLAATASILLPQNLFESHNSCSFTSQTSATQKRLSYSVFLSDILFQNLNQSHLKIGSIIVAARLKCADNATLNTSVHSTFQVNREVREMNVKYDVA